LLIRLKLLYSPKYACTGQFRVKTRASKSAGARERRSQKRNQCGRKKWSSNKKK